MGATADPSALKNLVRIGFVSSVNVDARTATVTFPDKRGMTSGALPVLDTHPTIVVQKKIEGTEWVFEAEYATAPRGFGLGEVYTTQIPDRIKNTSPPDEIKYNDEPREWVEEIEVHPWLPYIGQRVLCLYVPAGGSDGFVLGGI